MANVINAGVLHARDDLKDCAEAPPSEDFLKISQQLLNSSAPLIARQQQNNYNFQVHTHVVYSEQSVKGGYLTEDIIKKDMDVMNKYFSRSGISFTHVSNDYTQHQVWSKGKDQMEMKAKLRRGTYADLNLYYVAFIPGPAADGSPSAGICWLPIPNGRISEELLIQDGCLMLAETAHPRYPSDMTTTHEVGHWLGLLHTFEGNACGEGDTIEDTFPQQQPTHQCERVEYKLQDGRPAAVACNQLYPSNMFNLMDYSSCSNTFTAGQEQRMQYWAHMRRQIGGPSKPDPNPPKPEDPKPEDPKPEDPKPEDPKPEDPNTPPPPPPPTDNVANIWEQCGGRGWRGPTACAQGLVCLEMGPWYSQCRIG
ncbi:metalloprotease MEP1 [Metarhizium brunneum]